MLTLCEHCGYLQRVPGVHGICWRCGAVLRPSRLDLVAAGRCPGCGADVLLLPAARHCHICGCALEVADGPPSDRMQHGAIRK